MDTWKSRRINKFFYFKEGTLLEHCKLLSSYFSLSGLLSEMDSGEHRKIHRFKRSSEF
jgi:hypothetical protein